MKIKFDPPEQRTPDRDQGIKVQYHTARRITVRWRWYLILFIVASPLVYFLATILQTVFIVEADGYIQLDQIDIHSPTNGQIDQLHISTQDSVVAEQILIKINNLALSDRQTRVQNEILVLERQKLVDGTLSIQQATQERIAFANQQKSYYEKRLNKYISLYNKGAATESEINTARAQYEDALNTAMVENLRLQSPTQESQQRDTKLESLNLELTAIQNQIELQTIFAPKDSKVADIFVNQGEFVGAGTLIATLVSQSEITMTAFLDPRFADDYAKVGQTATIKFPSGATKSAYIAEVPELTSRSPNDISNIFSKQPMMILVKLRFDEPITEPLPNGLPVKVRFHYSWEQTFKNDQ
ncbi:MAG: HlyD family efflux transporter periplasmic adaptor subunit [Pseudomonadales bacterium]|nr:HlyD family efflux transporter periplasmic adaptor subunit [Pseudomonadales bacterium]